MPRDGDFRRIAVLGAGYTGSQIAAHLANAELDVWLFDLASDGADPYAALHGALDRMSRLQPAPLAAADQLQRITPATYQHDLRRLRDCDLIIEAVCETLDCKQGLYARIAPFLGSRTVIVSATARLPIGHLARALPEPLRARFCGMQFLPPPRYCRLIELIPGPRTDARVFDELESFAVLRLGKGVVRARDTPWFIANRLGLIALGLACRHAERLALAPDEVDRLTCAALQMPEGGLFGALDRLGLDTFTESLPRAAAALPDDPWLQALRSPDWLEQLLSDGRRGIRSGAGIYRHGGDRYLVHDPVEGRDRPLRTVLPDEPTDLLDVRQPVAFRGWLTESTSPGARFLQAWLTDMLHCCAVSLDGIADTVRDIDLALRWGFGLAQGPFELWQAMGWRETANQLRQRIAAGTTLVDRPLPDWVFRVRSAYTDRGAYSPASGKHQPPSNLPVYRRWLTPPRPFGVSPIETTETLFTTDRLRLRDMGDGIAVVELPSLTMFDALLLDALWETQGIVRDRFRALIVWQRPSAAGPKSSDEPTESEIEKLQQVALGLRRLPVPVVAAVQGRLTGIGYELTQHCDRVVATLESYLGPVDPLRGGLPLAGGCAAMARRVAQLLNGVEGGALILRHARLIGRRTVSISALEARGLVMLRPADPIVFNPYEVLFVACCQARALADSGYRPCGRRLPVGGAAVLNWVTQRLEDERAAGELDPDQHRIAGLAARVLCGGDAATGAWLEEEQLLALEREARLARCLTET